MQKLNTLVLFFLLSILSLQAQTIAEITNIRFYEHHSSGVTGQPFGYGANGSQSGYDFVNRTYYNSFDANTSGAYSNGEEQNIDMVEHNGPFGTNGSQWSLGFTSGISTIWNGEIMGNGITKWHKVTGGVTAYDNLISYTDLKGYYDSTKATVNIDLVQKDDVFIGRIRNTDLYVMIRCTNALLPQGPPSGSNDNLYFEFNYKFGSSTGVTGVNELSLPQIGIFPNPTSESIVIQTPLSNLQSVELFDINGKQFVFNPSEYQSYNNDVKLNLHNLPNGIYSLIIHLHDGPVRQSRLVKVD